MRQGEIKATICSPKPRNNGRLAGKALSLFNIDMGDLQRLSPCGGVKPQAVYYDNGGRKI